jgi:hypothetical protein
MSLRNASKYLEEKVWDYLHQIQMQVPQIQLVRSVSREVLRTPRIEVQISPCSYAEGFPPECGEYEGQLNIGIETSSDDDIPLTHEGICSLVEEMMDANPETMNDARLKVHEIRPVNSVESAEERNWQTLFLYQINFFCGVEY